MAVVLLVIWFLGKISLATFIHTCSATFHSFVHSFIHFILEYDSFISFSNKMHTSWYMYSSVLYANEQCVQKLQCQLLHSFIRFIRFIHSFVRSTFARELIHSFIHSFIHLFVSLIRSFHSLWIIHVCFIHLFCFIHSFIHFHHLFHVEFMFILNLHPSLILVSGTVVLKLIFTYVF